MNLRQLECDGWIFQEQILVANLTLADPVTKNRIISISVLTAGLTTARVTTGSGSIPIFAFEILDKYMLDRGFNKYKWERLLRNGKMKQVTRKIKVRT